MLSCRMIRNSFLGLAFMLLVAQTAGAWDYNSPIWAYKCLNTGSGNLCAYTNTNLKYGQGWNLYSFDYVNGTHWVHHSGGCNISNLTMTGSWYFSGIGASVSAGTGGIGIELSISGSTVNFTGRTTTYCNLVSHYFGGPHPSGMLFYRSENVFANGSVGGSHYSINASDYDYM